MFATPNNDKIYSYQNQKSLYFHSLNNFDNFRKEAIVLPPKGGMNCYYNHNLISKEHSPACPHVHLLLHIYCQSDKLNPVFPIIFPTEKPSSFQLLQLFFSSALSEIDFHISQKINKLCIMQPPDTFHKKISFLLHSHNHAEELYQIS